METSLAAAYPHILQELEQGRRAGGAQGVYGIDAGFKLDSVKIGGKRRSGVADSSGIAAGREVEDGDVGRRRRKGAEADEVEGKRRHKTEKTKQKRDKMAR